MTSEAGQERKNEGTTDRTNETRKKEAQEERGMQQTNTERKTEKSDITEATKDRNEDKKK